MPGGGTVTNDHTSESQLAPINDPGKKEETDHSLALPGTVDKNEMTGQSPLPSARSENSESNTQDPPAEAIIRRRHKKIRPYYYLGGNNGTAIVDEYLSSLGWERINDRNREDYKLKWCEIKSHNNYCTFKEGEQLCYQIPNNKVLTTKIGLLTSLQEYERVMNKVKKGKPRIMRYQEFFPETYRLDVREEREAFCEIYQDGEIWISKPTGLNQGKGIYLIRSREDINKFQIKMADIEEEVQATRKLPFKVPMARIAQRYITNPLLLNGKKFDVRNYMLVASTQPLVVFYRDGYCRLTCLPYDQDSTDLTGHLTNQFMQKKNPLYQEVKDETVWSMDRFNEHVNEKFMKKKDLPQDWVHTVLRKRCQQVMMHCFQSVRHKLECKVGYFDLYGCDFLVDDNFKVQLLEFNCNPALHTNCDPLKEVIPDVVIETLQLSLEIFNKVKARERIMPLAAHNQFVLLYNGDLIEAEERREKLKALAESRKRARSAQRRKRFMANFNMQKHAYPNQRNSDGETEPNQVAITTASSPTSPNNQAASYTTPAVLSATGQNVTNRLYPKVPQSTEITTNTGNIVSATMRSQTSLSTSSSGHSPTRVSGSKSVPNMPLKKPFYAGGTVPSRPYSAPRFHRARKSDAKTSSLTSIKSDTAEDEVVTEKSVAASLDAKLKEYRPIEPSALKNMTRFKTETSTVKRASGVEYKDQTQQFRGRPRERIKHIRKKSQEDELLPSAELDLPTEVDKTEKIMEANRKLLEAMTSSAIQGPSSKLPPSYHNRSTFDSEFSRKYLAGVASSRKGQHVMGKINGMIRSYKQPQPAPVNIELRDATSKLQPPNESPFHYQKLQYRNPSIRSRQTLQATTCTLEIGPKARRGLVAIPSTVAPAISASTTAPLTNGNNITRLRMMNVATTTFPAPGVFDNEEAISPQGVKLGLDDFLSHLQEINRSLCGQILGQLMSTHGRVDMGSRSFLNNLRRSLFQSTASFQPSEEATFHDPRTRINCVDSSTQTPISSYTLSSEEKVIWRLRTKVGASSNNVKLSGKPPMPSADAASRGPVHPSLTGIKTYPGIAQQSPRYIAVRPAHGTGVTMLISPPPVVSGKNMLPTIREARHHSDSSLYFDHAYTPQLSHSSQTPVSDTEDDLPAGPAIRSILNDVMEAKLEDNSEKWMAPG